MPCGGTNTAGTLSGALYTQSFAYDTLDRLTSGPLGAYSYTDSAHLHAATAIGGQWSGSYDASGDLTCRAPTSATTCSGTATGARLTYDNEGQLTAWQNAPTSPSSTDAFLYDGDGQRVLQQVVSGGTTTTTTYVGGLEEVATTGSSSTTTTYYAGGGQRVALAVNGALSYLAVDHLGSVSASFDSTGTLTAAQLYLPYGGVLYTTGIMPTSKGFTGQRADGATGLDYYTARYYDPLVGQFSSADTVLAGLNRYAYVDDNPLSRTDPSGHHVCTDDDCGKHTGSKSTGESESSPNLPTVTGEGKLIARINRIFQDVRTRKLLLTLMYSSTGSQFLEFLLQAGEALGGDNYITWKNDDSPGAYTNGDGTIQLNTGLLTRKPSPDRSPDVAYQTAAGDLVLKTDVITAAAGTLVHEAVESYFALEDGLIFHASQAMDYVAQWFGGKVSEELNASLGTGAPGSQAWKDRLSLSSWEASSDDGYKKDEDPTEPWWHSVAGVLVLGLKDGFNTLLPNPMGLSESMLTSGCVAAPCS